MSCFILLCIYSFEVRICQGPGSGASHFHFVFHILLQVYLLFVFKQTLINTFEVVLGCKRILTNHEQVREWRSKSACSIPPQFRLPVPALHPFCNIAGWGIVPWKYKSHELVPPQVAFRWSVYHNSMKLDQPPKCGVRIPTLVAIFSWDQIFKRLRRWGTNHCTHAHKINK